MPDSNDQKSIVHRFAVLILTLTAAQIWLSLSLFLDWGHGMGRALRGTGLLCGKRREQRYASVCVIQRSGALDAGFEHLSPAATAISVAQSGQRRDPALESPRIWRISG